MSSKGSTFIVEQKVNIYHDVLCISSFSVDDYDLKIDIVVKLS